MLRNLIKTAFRGLLKNKGFTIINIAGLALGLVTFLLITFYVVDELSYDRFNTKAGNIYRVNTDIKFGGNTASYAVSPPPLAAAMINSFPEAEKSVRIIIAEDIRFKKGVENIHESKVAYADKNIFDVFTLPMIDGNPQNALAEPHSIVITETAAKKYFNRLNVVGQSLTLVNENINYKITGVIRNMPVQSHFNFDYILSMPSLAASREISWNNFSFSTYVLLKPGTNQKKFETKLNSLIRKNFGEHNYAQLEKSGSYVRLNLTPLTAIHLQSNRQYELGTVNSMQNIYIFSAVALFVLLIACINFMNLSTARSANRAREVGVRKVLGSSRKYLIAQFLSESILITFCAAVMAALVAWALLPLFNQIANKQLSVSLHTLLWLLPVLTGIILIVGVLAGSYPAFFLSGFQPIHVLKGKLSAGLKGSGLRNFLVVFQFSISIFLIIGTLVIYNQLNYIQKKDLGFNRNQVLVIKNVNVLSNAKTLKQEIKQLPEVINASLSSFLPTGSLRAPNSVFTNKVADAKNAMFTEIWPVDEDYLPAMGMKLVMGRNFSNQFSTDSSGIIINETAAKMLGYNNPLDKKLYSPQENGKPTIEYHIIGVLKDFNFSSLRDNITPVVMVMAESNGALSIRVNTKNLAPFIDKVQNKWKNLAPDEHFEYSFMDDQFNSVYRAEQQTGKLFLCFTILAVIIACLGLFSLAAYAAEQRNKEIGIRKVLGAGVGAITAMLSKEFIKLVLISIVIAAPLGWLIMQKWLQGFAYRQNIQWWVLITAAGGAIIIAFITVSFQSIKAALANPVDSLRSE
jgi:putative ABC transport system permease protein